MWSNSKKLLILLTLFALPTFCVGHAVGAPVVVDGKVIGHAEARAGNGAPVAVEVRVNDVLVQVGGKPAAPPPAKKPTPVVPKISGLDTVSAISGDRIRGRVAGITPDGFLSVTADHFVGSVRMRRSNISLISLAQSPPKAVHALDLIELTNNDVIAGTIVAISPKAVAIKSAEAGDISIRRNIIKTINFSNAASIEIISQFEHGIMLPWEKGHGSWKAENKMLVMKRSPRNTMGTVAAPWDYNQSFTMTIDMSSTQSGSCQLMFFTSDKKSIPHRSQNDSVRVNLSNYYFTVTAKQGGQHHQLGNGRLNMRRYRRSGDFLFTISYDTETRGMVFWSGRKKIGSVIIPQGLAKGNYVVFGGNYNMKLRRLNIRRGVAEPNSAAKIKSSQKHQIFFKNGDMVESDTLALSRGAKELVANLDFGEVSIAREALANIILGSKDQEEPRRLAGDVLVETIRGRFTLRMTALTDKTLTGRAEAFGSVSLKRSAIRRVKFNIYR
jgi:hypothetical protein